MSRVIALVTCAELPDCDADSRLLIEPLARIGIEAVPAVWDDPAVDWAAFDLAIIRSCWDYPKRQAEFLEWAAGVGYVANPYRVLEWNTHKRYLSELAGAGIPIVPTQWVEPEDCWVPASLEATGRCVIKPAVSLGARDSGCYELSDTVQLRLAEQHVQRIQMSGRTVMIQPYLSGIDIYGETSLVYFGRQISHAVRKGAALDGPDAGIDNLLLMDDRVFRRKPPNVAELIVAERALDLVPGSRDQLLYARVDIVPGDDGAPVIMELELTEPSLFLALAPGAAERCAVAISQTLESQRRGNAFSSGDGKSAAVMVGSYPRNRPLKDGG